jgi:hypothetical protein
MSIKLDWELTDAPTDKDKSPLASPKPPAALASPRLKEALAPNKRTVRPFRLWFIWIAVMVGLGAAAGIGAWVITRTGWQRVTADVTALVEYEEAETQRGETALVMAVQDPNNADWLALRQDQLGRQQTAPQPLPMLSPSTSKVDVTGLEAIESDVVMAIVQREFATATGQILSFGLPQFYRRGAGSDWRRSAPPGTFWGQWLSWESPHLVMRYSERDAAFVARAAPALETKLALACAGWQEVCFSAPPVYLYLSGFVGSIGYDPLSNVEVRITPSASSTDADYYLSVPSPQIAGIPGDAAGETFLLDYLAVRLIASMAQHATRDVGAYQTLTALAINALELRHADPGYLAAAAQAQDHGGPSGGQATYASAQVLPGIPEVLRYQVAAGDTLSSIAAQFGTTVDAIALENNIVDVDVIQVDTWLLIPSEQSPQP